MNCNRSFQIINNWSFSEISPQQKELFFQHLNKCPDCLKLYNQTKKTIELIDKATKPVKVPSPPEYLINQIKTKHLNQKSKRSWGDYLKYTAIAASFLITLLAATIVIPMFKSRSELSDMNKVNQVLYQLSENQLSDINYQYQEQIAYEDELYAAESLYFNQEDIYFLVSSLSDEELEEFNDMLTSKYPDMLTMGGI